MLNRETFIAETYELKISLQMKKHILTHLIQKLIKPKKNNRGKGLRNSVKKAKSLKKQKIKQQQNSFFELLANC